MNVAKRLKSTRVSMGLTQKQVTERCGIDDSSLSAFENGRSEPRFSQLAKLAELYHVSVAYFFREEAHHAQVVMWRSKPERRRELEAEFLQLCRQYRMLELWTNEVTDKRLPELDDRRSDFFSYRQAIEMASKARDMMGLGQRPGESLYRVLDEVFGVKIFALELDNKGVAACVVSEEFGTGILLNRNCVRWRRNYDLAHELFHLLTWARFGHGEDVCRPRAEEEKLANCFAAHLLLPSETVRSAIFKVVHNNNKGSFEKLDQVAREFDVSLEALLWRMHYLFNWKELDTNGFIKEAKEYIKAAPRRDDSRPPGLPERYVALASMAVRHGDISLGRFAKIVGIGRREAELYTTGREPDYGEVPIPAV